MRSNAAVISASLFALALWGNGGARAAEWVRLAETDTAVWDGLAGSVEASTSRRGEKALGASGRVYGKRSGVYTFERWQVTVDSCRKGQGKLITMDMDGDFKSDLEWGSTGGAVARAIAAMLCGSAEVARK